MYGVRAGSLVLLHSPLVGPVSWGRLPELARAAGLPVAVPSVTDDDSAPYAVRYVASAGAQVAAAELTSPVVLVGHSGAGPLLPAVAAAAGASGRRIGGYLFLDAGIPRAGGDRLTLLDTEDRTWANDLRLHLGAGRRFPEWSSDDLAAEVPDADARAALVASIRPRGADFFTEPLPVPADWPDAPCGYLQLSSPYDDSARQARARGWALGTLKAGHFAGITEPERVWAAMSEVVGRM